MAENQQNSPTFTVERIYLKDVSYEAPGVPDIFLKNQPPQVEVQLSVAHRPIDTTQGFYEVVLSVQVTAKAESKPIFLVEVHQAGIFRIQGVTGETLQRALEINCGYVLLPFIREAINDFVGKGGFPQFLIAPINFEMLFEQKKTAAANQPAKGTA
jgi:preprotein translocase subunit SecB